MGKMTNGHLTDLYQAVVDTPDSDQPRLVYAEACESAGDKDRAEFIRIQIEYTARKRAGDDGWFEFTQKMFALKETYGDSWASPIRSLVSWFDFYRGFVEQIGLDARYYLAHAAELHQLAPIRRLALTGLANVIDELAHSQHLQRIVSLSLERENIGDEGLKLLAASPHLRKLVSLDLSYNNISSAGVGILAASPNLPALRKVDFSGNPETASEYIGNDQGQIVYIGHDSPAAIEIEQLYGRKTWLHTVRDNGRELHEAEF